MTETYDRTNDRRRLRVAAEIHDKGPVDLDLVEREGLQIAQRRVAAAEIVHRDTNAERLQPTQQRDTAIEVFDQNALGDLELEPARRKSGFEQDRVDQRDQVAMDELGRREVDRNLQRLRPGRGLSAGLAQDPLA